MSDAEANNLELSKQRSPAFPYINLETALERVRTIHHAVRDQPVPREVMAKAYGKPATSSATTQTFATLLQYGLLEQAIVNGQRRLRVSHTARQLINPNAPPAVVAAAKKESALKPTVFKELFEKYGTMDDYSDTAPKWYLTHEREVDGKAPFTERAAEDVLRVYRATISFAGLSDADSAGTTASDEIDWTSPAPATVPLPEHVVAGPQSSQPATAQQVKALTPAPGERELQSGMLSKSASYRVLVSGPIGVKEIERLIKKLEMDKEILADEDDEDDPRDHEYDPLQDL